MADSQDKTQSNTRNNIQDDLDAMLDEAGLQDEPEPFTDDTEAIDRLLAEEMVDEKSKTTAASDDALDKLLLMDDHEAPALKMPKQNPKQEVKKHDIDALLDQASDKLTADKPESQVAQDIEAFDDFNAYDEFSGFEEDLDNTMPDAEESLPEQAFDLFEEALNSVDSSKAPIAPDVKAEQLNTQPTKSTGASSSENTDSVSHEAPESNNSADAFEFVNDENNFEDAFGEIGALPSQEDRNVDEKPADSTPVSNQEPSGAGSFEAALTAASDDQLEDDFLIADFDITSDIDEFSEPSLSLEGTQNSVMEARPDDEPKEFSDLDDFFEADSLDEESAPRMTTNRSEQISTPEAPASNDRDELLSQITALWAAQESLKQQVTAATAANPGDSVVNELKLLANEQQSLRQLIENRNTHKKPAIVYAAIILSVLALLAGGALLALHFKTVSGFEALKQRNALIESELATLKNGAALDANDAVSASITDLTQQVGQIQLKLAELDGNVKVNTAMNSIKAPPISSEAGEAPAVKTAGSEKNNPEIAEAKKNARTIVIEKPSAKSDSEKVSHTKATKRPPKVVASVVKKSQSKSERAAVRSSAKTGAWVANLVSFRQDWYAQRKAYEFAQKGIIVQVIPVQVKGETWYRLSAGGFASRDDANHYAAKAKRLLNLTSVWVSSE